MASLILLNKPFRMLSQFSDREGRATLVDCIQRPGFYCAGRLDYDSEGLLLLTDDGALQQRIANPRHKLPKTYRVQVEGTPSAAALETLCSGVDLKDGPARALRAVPIADPEFWPRDPPVRQRREIPTSWIEVVLDEGRNRQVRRMTAALGHPTLRLVRTAIGDWQLEDLAPGQWREIRVHLPAPRPGRRPDRRPRRRV